MKKLFLSFTIIAVGALNSFATMWVKGRFEKASDDGSACIISCTSSSSLYCYALTTQPVQAGQNILNMNADDVVEFNDAWSAVPQSENGHYMTVQTYDANQNIVNIFYGYYGGMTTSEDQGTKTTTITLQH